MSTTAAPLAIRRYIREVSGNYATPTEGEVQLFSPGFYLGQAGKLTFKNDSTDTTAVIGFRRRAYVTREEKPQANIVLGPGEELGQVARDDDLLYTLIKERPATEDEKGHKGTSGVFDPLGGYGLYIAIAAVLGVAVIAILLLSRSPPATAPPSASSSAAVVPPPAQPAPAAPPVVVVKA